MSGLPGWIADPALWPVWARVRDRFESGGLEPRGRVRVDVPGRSGRHAVGALLGRSVTRDRVQIDLAALDLRLRERSGVGGLAEVLSALGAAPRDRVAERAAKSEARERPLALAAELLATAPLAAGWPEEWIAGLRRSGVLTGRVDSERVVTDAVTVLVALVGEWSGPSSRVELGARLLGDAHALDRDRLLHALVLRGLAAAAGEAVPGDAREQERLWASYGVDPDLLSRTCLTWGLRPAGNGVAERLRLAAEAGDPMHLTAWDLRRLDVLELPAGVRVLVCENPRVVEALAESGPHLGWAAVCTAGEPNLVVGELLARLAAADADLRSHGDFDWPGVAIVNRIVERYGARPWRMSAEDYLSAVRSEAPVLEGAPVEPSWDAELGAAMRTHRRAVHEESVLPDLLAALAESGGAGSTTFLA